MSSGLVNWLVSVQLGWRTAAAQVVAGYAVLLGWVIREDGLTELADGGLALSNKAYVGLQTPDADGVDTEAPLMLVS